MSAKLSIPEEAVEAARDAAIRRQSTRASVEAAAPLIVAAELERLADLFRDSAGKRHAVAGDDGGDECDGDCDTSDCHTVSAVATFMTSSVRLRRRAAELRGERKAEQP